MIHYHTYDALVVGGGGAGMMAAICVAYRPHWLATWSDRIYIAPPPGPG